MKYLKLLQFIFGVLLILVVGALMLFVFTSEETTSNIDSFDECVDAGYPILESWPLQCMTPGGEIFVDEIYKDVG